MDNEFKTDNAAKLTLRPFEDADIALMERWLYTPHVARWYKHPDHWLNELHQRHGAFSFLTHFIAEAEGKPIGFCQYYDTFYAQEHEVWNDEWDVSEKPGSIFSIDYLIGEPEFLRRGYGRQMILQMLEKLRKAGAKTVIVEPEEENAASGGALTACGFAFDGKDYYLSLEQNQTQNRRNI